MTWTRHRLLLALLWLVLSAVLSLVLSELARRQVGEAVQEHLRYHLLLSLDESLFSNAENRINDQGAIHYVGEQINVALQNIIVSRWYAPLSECRVQIRALDNVQVGKGLTDQQLIFSLPRNQIDREVVAGVACDNNWRLALLAAGLLAGVFALIQHLIPPPLTAAHRRWINYLVGHGYSNQDTFDIIQAFDPSSLTLSATQVELLEQLHDSEAQNFGRVLRLVTDSRVGHLDKSQVEWLLLGLKSHGLDGMENAMALATSEDVLEINLEEGQIRVHGLSVALGKTPLFYYAWYCRQRLAGDGWLSNPASNRPDKEAGQRLAEFMWQYGGHGKAISDLEQFGLKAKTLDQNRSKIKDEMAAALGEQLAARYLFDAEKHPDGVRMRYRIRVSTDQIRFLDTSVESFQGPDQ